MNELSDRLKRARNALGLTQKELSDAINVKLRGYQENESGKTNPRTNIITGFVNLGIDANWLLTGEGDMFITKNVEFQKLQQSDHVKMVIDNDIEAEKRIYERAVPVIKEQGEIYNSIRNNLPIENGANEYWGARLSKLIIDEPDAYLHHNVLLDVLSSLAYEQVAVEEFNEEYVLIPGYHISVSAGHGIVSDSEPIRRQLAFRRKWISFRKLNPAKLAVVFAIGDSMEPTIHSGNTLLVDLSDKLLSDGSIYVLRVGDNLFAKRLQQRFDGTVELISDNKEYKDQVVKPDELDQLQIIGKVVWIGKDLY